MTDQGSIPAPQWFSSKPTVTYCPKQYWILDSKFILLVLTASWGFAINIFLVKILACRTGANFFEKIASFCVGGGGGGMGKKREGPWEADPFLAEKRGSWNEAEREWFWNPLIQSIHCPLDCFRVCARGFHHGGCKVLELEVILKLFEPLWAKIKRQRNVQSVSQRIFSNQRL